MVTRMMVTSSCKEENEEDGVGEDEILSGDNKENEVQRVRESVNGRGEQEASL